MIDPKFNTLPKDAEGDFEEEVGGSASGAAGGTKPRRGLSINDTIAASADMSAGSRGVDTSGTSVGAGAGAGTTFITPEDDGSPAPNIVPGARGSGTTPRADTLSGQIPTTRLDAGTEGQAVSGFTTDEISERAYRCWHQRGCPHGSPEEDWHTAVRQLREERDGEKGLSATA
jgi:hypothetical protein